MTTLRAQTTSLSIASLTTVLGKREVLRKLDLAPLYAGQIVALLGPNGSGKSTLLKSIAGHISSHGSISWGEAGLDRLTAVERSDYLAYLPQFLPEGPRLTVVEALMVSLSTRAKRPLNERLGRIQKTLDLLNIGDLSAKYANELSGGQRQMVALAQVLCLDPEVLLLDEPLAALDLSRQFQVMNTLKSLATARQLVVLLVMHDLNQAMRYCDQVILLREGRKVAQGAVKDIMTSQNLALTFNIAARIERCSRGMPFVMVDDAAPDLPDLSA